MASDYPFYLERPTYLSLWRVRSRLFLRSLRNNWDIFVQSKIGLIGLSIIVLYALLAISHPILMNTIWDAKTYDPERGFDYDATQQPAPPSLRHPLGTDTLGRDVFSQLASSATSEFLLGLVAAAVTVGVGTTVGAISAYFGGIVDTILMRLADIMIMLPLISLVIVVSVLFGIDLIRLGLIIGLITGFGGVAVILKSQALSVKVKPYVEAATVAGGGRFHIIFVHIIPNLLPLSFLYMMFTVTGAIFSEAALSYFGFLDVTMSWGMMIHNTRSANLLLQVVERWWLIFPASVSITLLSSSFYLVGRALDEVVNPRLRNV